MGRAQGRPQAGPGLPGVGGVVDPAVRPARSVTIGSAQAASVPQRDPEAYCAPFRRGGPMWPPDVPPPGRRQCFYIVWGISPSADGEFLSERSERNERIAGGWDFKERPAANALVFQESHPRTPFFTGEPEGCVGSCVRRGNLLNGVYALSLPFYSIDESGASTRYNAPKLPNRKTGR